MTLSPIPQPPSSPRRGRVMARRRAAWVALVVGLMGVASGFGGGCAEKQRYEVLSFFFDGVPAPEGVEVKATEPTINPWEKQLKASDPRAKAILAQVNAEKAEPKAYYFHTPYLKRDCFGCHARERSMSAPQMTAELCQRCHEGYFKYSRTDWVHGPAALGQCAMCHEAHKSEYKGLLKRPQPDICLTCHEGDRLLKEPYHAAAAGGEACSTCHDPHEAGNRLLLVDSRTFERRKPGPIISVHPRQEVGCATCHPAEQSNRVVENVDLVCVTCHETQARALSQYHMHGANDDKPGCTSCHTPHRSSLPHLLRRNAEKACLSCHDLEKVNQGGHPKVWKVDCLVCHNGHESDRPNLLRPGIEQVAWEEPGGDGGGESGGATVAVGGGRGRASR